MDTPFHISLPCKDPRITRKFYVEQLQGKPGRKAEHWVDIDLFGHQLTFIRSGRFNFEYASYSFENTILPSFHFGVILDDSNWKALFEKNKSHLHIQATPFLKSKKGAHTSFFVRDPNDYIIEFKRFDDPGGVFEK